MALKGLLPTLKTFVETNDTALLTGVGITGTVTTAYLTGRASFKAATFLQVQDAILLENEERYMTNREKLELVWVSYIPAIGVGAATVSAIFFANRIDSKRAAALTAAYGISERAFTEYKEKVVEKFGETKEAQVRAEVAQDRVDRDPITQSTVIIGNGEVLCRENWGGRYFKSSVQAIEKARNDLNHQLFNHSSASLSEFFDMIGLPPTGGSDEVGWNINNTLEIAISTALATDDTPCLVLDFQVAPVSGYGNLY